MIDRQSSFYAQFARKSTGEQGRKIVETGATSKPKKIICKILLSLIIIFIR